MDCKSTPNRLKRIPAYGFSLVELLVVIVVIGVISALAVAGLIGLSDQADENSSRQTAQMIVSIAGGAQAAGDETIAAAEDRDAALALVFEGLVGTGIFEGTTYKVDLTPDQADRAKPYIVFQEGRLEFNDSYSP